MAKQKKQKIDESQLEIFKKEEYKGMKFHFLDAFKEHFVKQIIFIALIVILVIFVIMNLNNIGTFIKKIINILMPIIVGWILTYLLAPLYDLIVCYIEKCKNKKNSYVKKIAKFSKFIASFACTFIVILIGVGLIYLFVPQLYNSFSNFISNAPVYYENIVKAIDGYSQNMSNVFLKKAFDDIQISLAELVEKSGDLKNINFTKVFTNVYNGFYFSFKMILNIFVGIIVMIYSLNLKEELTNGLKRILFAVSRKDIAQKVLSEVRFANKVFSGFLVGKILDSFIIGILCYVCCIIMKMPYTPLISVIVGITNIIPFFGPFIGAIPSFAIILLEEPFTWRPWGFLVFILALQQLDGNIIGPKILGDKTGVGSFWVLFSILLFGGLFGFVGMIIAVPLWAIISRLFDEYIVTKLKAKNYPLTTEDYKKLKEYNEHLKNNIK